MNGREQFQMAAIQAAADRGHLTTESAGMLAEDARAGRPVDIPASFNALGRWAMRCRANRRQVELVRVRCERVPAMRGRFHGRAGRGRPRSANAPPARGHLRGVAA